MLLTTLGFELHYEIERANRSSAIGVAHEFRRPRTLAAQGSIAVETAAQSLVLEITPFSGESWIGSFHGGPEGLDGVFATPCADTVCVVVKGQGYWVPVLAPTTFELIQSAPIKQVVRIPDRNVLLFVSFTRLVAYGPCGFLWLTEDLSWDGLEITDVGAKTVLGTAWDSPANHRVPFSVDVETGKAEGGSSPAKYSAGQPANGR